MGRRTAQPPNLAARFVVAERGVEQLNLGKRFVSRIRSNRLRFRKQNDFEFDSH